LRSFCRRRRGEHRERTRALWKRERPRTSLPIVYRAREDTQASSPPLVSQTQTSSTLRLTSWTQSRRNRPTSSLCCM
jgi:hypothetical protein